MLHWITASGAVAGLIALHRILDGQVRQGLLWLIICQILDGIDGPLARKIDVQTHAPKFDGHILDLVVDYVTCVVVPVILMLSVRLVDSSLAMPLAGLVLLTSALWFARVDQETPDHWFNGFPAAWNIVIPTLMILHSSSRVTSLVLVAFSALQLGGIKFPHLMRVTALRKVTSSFALLYLACFVLLSADYPNGPHWARWVLAVVPIYLGLLVAWRTWFPQVAIAGQRITS